MTAPPLNEPFTTLEELAVWVRLPEIPEDQQNFAHMVLEATAVVIRDAGDSSWTRATIPARAKLMADLKSKNFFEHPTGAVSETVGPLSERYLDEVVQQLQLSPAEIQLLAQLAAEGGAPETPGVVTGIWALSTFRGELETHGGRARSVIHVPYWRRGSQMVPYFTEGELGAPLT